MEFVGKGLLLEVSCFDSKDKENPSAPAKRVYKYTFLVGDQKDKKSFIENAHVESCLSDHVLLNGDEKVFDEIDIVCRIGTFRQKVNGVWTEVQKPTYVVVDKVGG